MKCVNLENTIVIQKLEQAQKCLYESKNYMDVSDYNDCLRIAEKVSNLISKIEAKHK